MPHATDHKPLRLHIVRHRRACPDRRAAPNCHGRDQLRVRPNEDVVLNYGFMLGRTVIVAGDCAGANVYIPADLGVANVGKMIGFGVLTEMRFLDFNEITDVNTRVQNGLGTNARKRSNTGA